MLSAIKLTNLFSRIASNSLRFLTRAAFEEYNGSSAKWSKPNNYNQRKRLVFNQNYKKNSNQIGCQQAQFELKQESVFKMFLLDPTSGRTFNFSSAVCLSACHACNWTMWLDSTRHFAHLAHRILLFLGQNTKSLTFIKRISEKEKQPVLPSPLANKNTFNLLYTVF